MSEERIYGHTNAGLPITDETIEELAGEAEAGFDVDQLIARRGKRGRPALGSAPASVESVRLDPELRDELAAFAAAQGISVSEVVRTALRKYLRKLSDEGCAAASW